MVSLTMSIFDGEDFKKLKKKYYKKISDKFGFKDIENDHGDLIDHQNVFDFSQRINFRSDLFESTRSYYAWACEMIYHGKFKSDIDKVIWSLHADGKSSYQISDSVKIDRRWISRKLLKIQNYLELQYKKTPQNS